MQKKASATRKLSLSILVKLGVREEVKWGALVLCTIKPMVTHSNFLEQLQ